MTILESLREKVSDIDFSLYPDLKDLFEQYDLALENALLKLKNRGVEIKDLKHRLKKLENPIINCETCRKCGELTCGNDTEYFTCWENL